MPKKNPHIGSTFESWLDEHGIRDEVTASATSEAHRKPDFLRKAILETAFGLHRIGLIDAKTLREIAVPLWSRARAKAAK